MDENVMPGAEQNQTTDNVASEQTPEQTPEQTQAQVQMPPQALEKPALSWQPEGANTPSPVAAVQPEPPKKQPIAIFVVIAVLVVSIIALVAGFLLAEKPEDAVRKAKEKTGVVMEERAAKMIAEMPALAQMNKDVVPQKTNFSFTFEGMQGAQEELGMQLISSMLKGFGVRGDVAVDGDNMVELDAKIGLGDIELLNGYIFCSPDQVAFGVPKFSETIFSIIPHTFKEDFIASPIYAEMVKAYDELPEYKAMFVEQMNDQLDTLQGLFAAQADALAATGANEFDPELIQDEFIKRMGNIYAGAVYEKATKENGLKVYQIQLQGAAVKQTIVDLARYIYLESPVMNLYDSMFTAEMLGGMTYKQMMEEAVVTPIEQYMPEVPLTMTIKVDGKGIIRFVKLTADPAAVNKDGNGWKLDQVLLDYSFDENDTISCKLELRGTDLAAGQIGMTMDIIETYAEGEINDTVSMLIDLGGEDSVSADVAMKLDQQGKCDFNFDLSVAEGGYATKLSAAAGGGVKLEGDKTTWAYPAIDLSISEGNDLNSLEKLGSITLGWKSETSPLPAGYTPTRTFTPLTKMTQEQFAAEAVKYSAAIEAFANQLQSLMSGVSP